MKILCFWVKWQIHLEDAAVLDHMQAQYPLRKCSFFFVFLCFFCFVLFLKFTFFYLFIYDCVESSLLCEGSLQLRRVGTTLHRGARASHRRGLSRCGAQAPDAQAQQLWLTGPVAPRHVGSSQTGARTRVPRIGRQILNHCATREAPKVQFWHRREGRKMVTARNIMRLQ